MSATRFYRTTTFRFFKLLSAVIGAVLGIFCNFGGTLYGPAPMYGPAQFTHFKITGTVQSADQSLPVKGLSVSVSDTVNAFIIIDSTKTDSLGRYLLKFINAPWKNTCNLEVKDIDSMENGSFIMKDTIVSIPADGEINVDLKVDRSNQ